MIITRIQMFCEGDKCDEFFPQEGSVDGVIWTLLDLRNAAMKKGWRRKAEHTHIADLCPKCAVKTPRKSKKKGVEYASV